MGDLNATILAAEEGGGQSNFLIPNGTFFFVLIIFLIVLGVIAKWVVPPIKVLRERDAMVTRRSRTTGGAADQFAAADADYRQGDGARRARTPRPSGTRPARKDARSSRTRGPGQPLSVVDAAAGRRGVDGQALAGPGGAAVVGGRCREPGGQPGARRRRTLGTVPQRGRGGSGNVDLHRSAHRVRGHRLPALEVRCAAGSQHDEEPAGDRSHPAWRTAPRPSKKVADADTEHAKALKKPRPRRPR